MKKSIFLVVVMFSVAMLNAKGQQLEERTVKTLSREQMIQDIDTLFHYIEEVHPDMYFVYSKEQLSNDIERVKSELEPSGDIYYFFKQVAPLVVKLGDGHTYLPPPYNEPSDYDNVFLFPFLVKITYPDIVLRVQDDFTKTQNAIPVGAQITNINNRQANVMVQEMIDYISGETYFYRISGVESRFQQLIHTLYRDSTFNIEYVFNQEKHYIQVKGISYQDLLEKYSQQGLSNDNLYTFRNLPDKNIGIIELNVFWNEKRFKAFLDSTFQVLQKENIGNLIIDIRRNGGGDSSLGNELFHYISHVPYSQSGKTVHKFSDILKQYYVIHGETPPTNPNGIEVRENTNMIQPRENNLRYKGNVYLLTSHFTFSSAAMFSWAFKYFGMGTVVGEETGGLSVHFGAVMRQKLPNSGFHYGISTRKFYLYGATDDNIHGTLPDYNVEAEKALDFTIDLITGKK